jgi:adenine-specific DNA-methyltransferase
MPILNWIGKEKVVSHHQDVPFRILEKQYSFDPSGNSGNKIIHGDNLEGLKSLLPEYEGRVKCIYIDPPYNTGNENWVYNDNVNHPKIKKWLGQVVGKESEDLSRHDKWLCMMYPRLKLLHKLLADDGVIFISLDETEIVNLRCMMDEIFGENNFVAQLILLCNPKGRSQDKYFSTNHEYVTVYSKTVKPKDSFSITKDETLVDKEYKFTDENGKFRLLELRNTHREFSRQTRPNLFYPLYVNAKTGNVSIQQDDIYTDEIYPLWPDGFEGCWTWGKDLAKEDAKLLTARKSKSRWKIFRKAYAVNTDGEGVKKKLFSILQDPRFYTEKGQIVFGEMFPGLNKNDFPQPKSVDLVKELLLTCTSDDDIVLDSFAGSGTTGHAVLNLNKQDGGNRKFILLEMEDYAETITAERIKRVINGYAGKEGTGGGFDFYTLGEELFTGEYKEEINDRIGIERIKEYMWFSETRTSYVQPETPADPYYIGIKDNTAYYLIHDKDEAKALDYETISTIQVKASQYIIYADSCQLPIGFLQRHNIFFKKNPKDIIRF